ncbi:MAG: phosphatase PAP2 family protein [Flavobacteriaceae bacterium]|nr:phosphatase PAP2 family protein [Flavobacteriaceae bacterium]
MDLIKLDEQIFLYLNGLGTTAWDSFWLIITEKLTWIPLYLLFAWFIFKNFGLKVLYISILTAGLLIFFTDQISHFYKDSLILRLRPCYNEELIDKMRLVKDTCGGKYGFFSGHASNHFAVAVFIGLIFRKFKWVLPVLLIWAAMIAYSRIYIGVHYPLDVLSGTLIGSLSGLLFYRIWQMANHKLAINQIK